MADEQVQAEAEVEAPKLKAMRVVRAIFGVDPEGQKRFNKAYGYPENQRASQPRRYDYLTDQDFEKGDTAVVETPQGFTLVTIQEVGPDLLFGNLPGHKWIIDKVDIKGHNDRKARAERRQFLMDSLTNLAKELKKITTLEDDLQDDPTAMKLLEELKGLQ